MVFYLVQMKSPAVGISGRDDLGQRLASVLAASRAIRHEAALVVSESSETRVTSRKLRMESRLTTNRIEARRQVARRQMGTRPARFAPDIRLWLAHALADALSAHGCPAFVVTEPQELALHQ